MSIYIVDNAETEKKENKDDKSNDKDKAFARSRKSQLNKARACSFSSQIIQAKTKRNGSTRQ